MKYDTSNPDNKIDVYLTKYVKPLKRNEVLFDAVQYVRLQRNVSRKSQNKHRVIFSISFVPRERQTVQTKSFDCNANSRVTYDCSYDTLNFRWNEYRFLCNMFVSVVTPVDLLRKQRKKENEIVGETKKRNYRKRIGDTTREKTGLPLYNFRVTP